MQQAWASLNAQIGSNTSFNVDERTMGSRNLVTELTRINLDAQNSQNITNGSLLHDQKMSNLCVYFATLSSLRHEIKKILGNSMMSRMRILQIVIPYCESIDELLKLKDEASSLNALSFERMLSVLLGCVSPRALSGRGQILKRVVSQIIRICN